MLKKAILLAVLLAGWVAPVQAATDAQTVKFLEQLNLYYYCLMREGLHGFTCNVQLVRSDKLTEQFRAKGMDEKWLAATHALNYNVSVSPVGEVRVTPGQFTSTGDEKLDAEVQKAQLSSKDEVNGQITIWNEITFKPDSDQETYARDCKVTNTADGFIVTESEKGSMTTSTYDKQAKLVNLTGSSGLVNVTTVPEFWKTAKGYLLSGTRLKVGGVDGTSQYEYQVIGKYWLLKQITSVMHTPVIEGELSFSLVFSNYVLNE